jgi:hypothetical protein
MIRQVKSYRTLLEKEVDMIEDYIYALLTLNEYFSDKGDHCFINTAKKLRQSIDSTEQTDYPTNLTGNPP